MRGKIVAAVHPMPNQTLVVAAGLYLAADTIVSRGTRLFGFPNVYAPHTNFSDILKKSSATLL
jgi:hypothetical protein